MTTLDLKRIQGMTTMLASVWAQVADLRLGQLLANCLKDGEDLFYVEDDVLLRRLIELTEPQAKKDRGMTTEQKLQVAIAALQDIEKLRDAKQVRDPIAASTFPDRLVQDEKWVPIHWAMKEGLALAASKATTILK